MSRQPGARTQRRSASTRRKGRAATPEPEIEAAGGDAAHDGAPDEALDIAGEVAAGDVAAGDVAAGDVAAGDVAAGDVAAGDVVIAAPAVIRIEIDPAITAGYIHDRYDLSVRGRAVSSDPVEEIAIRLDGEVAGRVQYGHSDQQAPAELPDGSEGVQAVFRMNVPLRRAQARRMCACTIVARTRSGDTYEEEYDLLVDPDNPMPASVAAGPTRSSQAYGEVRPPVILYVERSVLDDSGQLLVHGWAISLNPMITIQVYFGEERLAAARLGGQRDDVGSAFPAFPNSRMSGFTLSKRIEVPDIAPPMVRIEAISRNGFVHEAVLPLERVHALVVEQQVEEAPQFEAPMQAVMAPQGQPPAYRLVAGFTLGLDGPSLNSGPLGSPSGPFVSGGLTALGANADGAALARPAGPPHDPRREIRLFCDQIELDADGHVSVTGWAVCAIGVSSVMVYLDGQPMGEADLGLLRSDVGEEYRQIPMARYSGFRFDRELGSVFPGEHRVQVVVRNGLDDVREEVRTFTIERPEVVPAVEFRLEIDTPAVTGGVAADPVTGRLTIEGWALSRSGISGIEVLLDDQRLGDAHYGLARQDVGAAFPDWMDSLRSGYAFHCPPRSLRDGEHVVQLNVRARSGDVLEHRFRIQVKKSEEFDDGIAIRRRMTQVEADVSDEVLDSLGHRPAFRLILWQNSAIELDRLLETVASLRSQVYRDWRLVILTSDADTGAATRALIAEAASDLLPRIEIADASDAAVLDTPIGGDDASRRTRLIGFLSPGDRLGCDAMLRFALAGGLHREADLLYADELRISPASHEREAFFKPDFSPDLLLATNYFGRPWFAAAPLLARVGATLRDLIERGEYDIVLRCSEAATEIHHIASVLCQRGPVQIDLAETEVAALTRATVRRGIAAEVEAAATPGTWRVRRTQPATGLVSIIIPTCAARGYIETCITSLRERTTYRNFEIVCVDNIPDSQLAWKVWLQQNADVVVPMPDAFNWSHFNNRGVEAASGEYLLFLNDDIEVVQPDWLDVLLEHAQRPEVAVVGPQLLYPDGKVQHAGMFLAARGVARHAFRFAASDDPGYFGLALTQRNVMAVTGACMLMRRTLFQALGGFEEAHEIVNNDLDFCLRAHQAGKLVVFTPYASLVHYEAASRDRLADVFDLGQFEARWNTLFAAGDPYFSPRLSRQSDDYRPDEEPAENVFAGHPLYRHSDIRRILAVKVDHIGDFVTALPAIRRLKQVFPAAEIHVLASRSARAFVDIEDSIDGLIEFEFFHAVSGQGQKEISKEEYEALRQTVAAYRFDLAIDLRKHLDTRDVLRYTPARLLAGYDHMGQFPFLDISLEWEGDRHLHRKRSHVTDDLINLVEAVATAGSTERTRLDFPGIAKGAPDFLPEDASALFDRPVVAIHPGVGNVMRQWPPEHFASLIDLLVATNGVNTVLIGGPEEAELAEEVMGQVAHRNAVVSLVGRTTLRQLPALLRACVLYVGNNSGPKHIAAALGVPTIGIHSGVVDAIEWGPIGPRAVAIRRNMACSPCYLARREDCPRGFACMRGLDPVAVQMTAETLLAQPVPRTIPAPLVEQVFVPPTPPPAPGASPEAVESIPTKPARPARRSRRRPVPSVAGE
ncbi:MAG: glycosyltransferase family 9 protein [Acetobacteraceae bacterium]